MTRTTLVVLVIAALAPGCADRAIIRSQPPGAQVYIDDQLIGSTPVTFTVPRSELKDSYALRVTADGYEPYIGTLPRRLAAGRATAAVFTLGIFYLFKSPWRLTPPATIPLRPCAPTEAELRAGKDIQELNRGLKQLLMQKKISPEEYEQRTKRLLEGN